MGVLVPQIGVAHAASTTFSFGAAGDFGAANAVTATLDNMASSNLNFGLALGDLSYNQIQPASAWCTYVHQNIGSLPFELTSGNHEDGGDVAQGLIWDFASCLPNQMSNMAGKYGEQYTFDYPVANPIARFIMISPGLLFSNGDTYNYNQGGADYNWVSNQIDSARAAGIQWIIVGMHKVCLTSGGSACDVGTPLMNLLISKHVDLILQGHDHNYQRSKQIAFNGGSCTSVTPAAYNAACVVNNGASGTYQEGSGTVIVIQGTGGVDDEYGAIYQNPDSPYFEVRSGSNLNPQKGFVKYTVSTSGITAQFVPSTTTSTFTDSFAISATAGPTPTPVPSGETIMSDNFDSQSPGPPLTGTGSNEFTSVAGTNNLTVQNGVADSAPNALALTMQSGGGSYMYEQYGAGYVTHTLQFNVRLGSNFNLPSADYMVLAQTLAMDATSSAGKVSLVVPGGGGGMYVDYFDSGGNQHFLWSGTALSAGSWHTIDLQDTVGSGTTGALALFLDGRAIASQSSIDTGNLPLGAFSLGNEHSSTDAAIGGSLYLDDVATMNGIGFPGGSGSTPTPTPTSSPTATPSVTPSPTPTAPPGVISSIDFDGQGTGALQTGPAYTQFSGQSGAANLAVESTIADSAPNALAVTMKSGGGVYGLEQYAGSGYATHTLQFNVQLGSDFVLPPADYMTLAQTLAAGGGGSNAGKLSLIVSGGTHTLHIDYFDSTGAQHYLYSSAALALGSWHNISLQETAGVGTGALVLSMDGKSVASATGIDIGSQGVGYFALGDEYSPADASIAGHLYLDDVNTTSTAGGSPTPTPTSTPASIPTATPTFMPTSTATPTSTSTPTSTATPSPTTSPTSTPTSTPTPTVSPTPSPPLPPTPTPTPSGGTTVLNVSFDGQQPGGLVVGSASSEFSGTTGGQYLAVQNQVADSPPNSLAVTAGSRTVRDAYEQYASGYVNHTLQFNVELGSDLSLPSGDSLTLAQIGPSQTRGSRGTVSLDLMGGTNNLQLTYVDSAGTTSTVQSTENLNAGTWYTITVSQTEDPQIGSIVLTVSGQSVASATGIDTGSRGVKYVAIGEAIGSRDSKIGGHIYFDDVLATTP